MSNLKNMNKRDQKEQDALTRIAIVNADRCKPKKCRQECKKSCPVVRMGKLCIEVASDSKIAFISEELCIGCGICVKVTNQKNYFFFRISIKFSKRNALSKPFISLICQVI
jgi:Pyruvate/2-oxoacid:ferredoxin oxidoreductase delta subunit